MRVLNAAAESEEASGVTAVIRRYAFTACLGVALAAYMVLLINPPGADAVSVYPEPVDNVLYDGNFPNHRGADPWTKVVHRSQFPATCEDRSAHVYREVGAQRCNNFIERFADTEAISARDGDRCRYFYENVSAAQLGTRVRFVQSGGACLVP